MRVLAVVFVLGACGDTAATVDAPPAGDSGLHDDAPPITPTCAAPALFDAGIVPTRTLHVAAGATGGDGSVASPFGTIEDAAAAATPGTAIRLGPGMHATGQFVSRLRGTAAAPIWIGGEPGGAKPILAGGAQAIQLAEAQYVVIHDLEVRGQTGNGINLDDGGMLSDATAAHHLAVARVHVHDVGGAGNNDCIKVSGIRDLAIYDSVIERCGAGGSGVDHVGCHRSVIARNVFDGAMATAVQAKGGSSEIDVRDNRMRIAGARTINLGGSTDLGLFRPPLSTTEPNAEAIRVRVYNNVITGLGTTATPFAFVGCVDCLAAHNLVRGQQRWHARILQETPTQAGYTFTPSSGGRVIANTFVFSAASLATAVNVGADTAPATFSFSHNLWYATDNPGASMPTLPVTETAGVVGMPSGYANVPDDPHAAIPGALLTGSAEWAARPPKLAEVPGTIDGLCRDEPTTIGPQEAASGSI